MKDKILIIIKILLILVMLAAAGYLVYEFRDDIKALKEYAQIRESVIVRTPQKENEAEGVSSIYKVDDPYGLDKNIDEEALRMQNDEYHSWLYVPEVGIDLPVVWPTDNYKYLDKSFLKNENVNGCLFFDATGKPLKDMNTVIHGHNIKSGLMFGRLKELIDKKYEDKEVYAYLLTDGRWQQYRLLCVYTAEDINAYPYTGNFTDDELYEFMDYIYRLSRIKKDSKGDTKKLLTLSTCHGDELKLMCVFEKLD